MALSNFLILRYQSEGDDLSYALKLLLKVEICVSFPSKVVQSCTFVLNSCLCFVIQIVVDNVYMGYLLSVKSRWLDIGKVLFLHVYGPRESQAL